MTDTLWFIRHSQHELTTKDQWKDDVVWIDHLGGCVQTLETTKAFIKAIDEIRENSQSLDEAKQKLQDLINDRIDFIKFAKEHLP